MARTHHKSTTKHWRATSRSLTKDTPQLIITPVACITTAMGLSRFQSKKEWYLKLANQGYVSGQKNMGHIYLGGKSAPQDYQKARKWFESC